MAAIAAEKAGIIKPDTPCVISWQPTEAMEVLLARCVEMAAPCLAWGRDWDFRREEDGDLAVRIRCPLAWLRLELLGEYAEALAGGSGESGDTLELELVLPAPSLLGIHQYINAAASAVAAWWLSVRAYPQLTYERLAQGISTAAWPGRMQRLQTGVLANLTPAGSELWLDGAHNHSGAAMAAATMADLQPPLPLYLINGRTRQRDIRGFLAPFLGMAQLVCGVLVRSEPSGEAADNIARAAREMGFAAVAADDLLEAVRICLAHSQGAPCRILICGSLYLAGDVLLMNRAL